MRPKVVYLSDSRSRDRNAALSRALEEHHTALRRFLHVRLANEQDRDEIAQEVYIRLCQQTDLPEKLSLGSEKTRAYLFAIATNLICDMRRKAFSRRASAHETFDESMHRLGDVDTEEILQHREELELVKSGILNLEPKCRRAFVLSRFFDMSYRDISDEMGVSCSMIEKYISQALLELRRITGKSR